jgi:hypothetical protein
MSFTSGGFLSFICHYLRSPDQLFDTQTRIYSNMSSTDEQLCEALMTQLKSRSPRPSPLFSAIRRKHLPNAASKFYEVDVEAIVKPIKDKHGEFWDVWITTDNVRKHLGSARGSKSDALGNILKQVKAKTK